MMRNIALVAVFVVLAFLGAMVWMINSGGSDDQFAQCRGGSVGGGAIGGPFELVSETGETVTDKDVITQPTLVYFGYTYCPDVCPLDTTRNAEAVDLLEADGKMVQPVMVTIDPDRDTPEVLTEFTDYIHPRMLGLTGSAEQIKAAAKAYRAVYQKQPAEDEYYLVNHSTYTYLVLPEHGFVDFFKRDDTPEQMATRIGCFVDNM